MDPKLVPALIYAKLAKCCEIATFAGLNINV